MTIAFPKLAKAVLALTAGVLVGGAAASGASVAPNGSPPPATVTASPIACPGVGCLPRGRTVRASRLIGVRTFVTDQRGFALADTHQAQYPVQTRDRGQTWRIDGPPLHVDAAQAPLAVTQISARGSMYFAWGGPDSGGNSVDVTPDRGGHWWRASLGDMVLSVVAAPSRLIGVAQTSRANGRGDDWVYVSTDGGHSWHLNTSFGAMWSAIASGGACERAGRAAPQLSLRREQEQSEATQQRCRSG